MSVIDEYLSRVSPLIIDGALGTELEQRGCDLNDEIWSARLLGENPKAIQDVEYDYLKAGADFIITASYQATYEGFMERGMGEKDAENLIISSIKIAKEVRDKFWRDKNNHKGGRLKPLVAASIGPYGAYLADGSEFRGDYKIDFNGLKKFHHKRLNTIINAKPDLLAIETIPCFTEVKAIIELLKNYPDIYAWVSFSAKDGIHINSGEKIRECARWLEDKKQVAAIGVNCTAPGFVTSLIKEICSVSSKPVAVYPNKGGEYDGLNKIWKPDSNLSSFELMAEEWFEAGARLIGGCCQTTPGDIKAVADKLKKKI